MISNQRELDPAALPDAKSLPQLFGNRYLTLAGDGCGFQDSAS